MNTIWYDYTKVDTSCGTAIAIGNFDGLHLGHNEIMNTLKKVSKENGLKSLCYTFSSHPINVIKGDNSLPLIADNEQKEKLLSDMEIDSLFFEDFKRVKDIPAGDFVKDILVSKLNMKVIVVGLHNHYGKNGEGDIKLLKELGQKYGFLVFMAESFYLDNVMCSSTKVREYIKNGKIEKANEMLGRKFTISGTIVKDKGLGKKIGFPTANIKPKENMLLPEAGVYSTCVMLSGQLYKSITNVGTCPTVNDNNVKLETHILDFEGDIYGDAIKIIFISKMREIITFENITALKNQLHSDVLKRRGII